MTWTADDSVMADLRAWLVDQGFVVLSDSYDSDSFGNQGVVLTRPIAIQLVRDRGEWGVSIAGSDGAWRWLDRWVTELTPGAPQPVSAADQDAALRALLPEIEKRSRETRDPGSTE